MWIIQSTGNYERRHKQYTKKYQNELRAVLNNLDTFFKILSTNVPIINIKFGWLHPEPKGVLAITQAGGHGKSLKVTRLYIFPEKKKNILYLLTIGDKNTQQEDIKYCNNFVNKLRRDKNG